KVLPPSVRCDSGIFGGDPAPYIIKSCFVPASPPGYNYCSQEGSTCNVGAPGFNAAFGVNGNYVYKYFNNVSQFGCSIATFGTDPAPNIVKNCLISIVYDPLPDGYTWCSAENGTCNFTGTLKVAFGANGNYTFATFTGGAPCNDSSFPEDPAYGVVKACY